MSRIIDALRKSEDGLREGALLSPERFLDEVDRRADAQQPLPAVEVRPVETPAFAAHLVQRGLAAERYRSLRSQLEYVRGERGIGSFVVTSALPQEGKTCTALNLATVLSAQNKKRILFVEADMRRCSCRQLLSLEKGPGLSDCLENGLDPFSAIQQVEPLGFHLLAAGEPASSPVDLLQSKRFSEMMDRLKASFDWVIVDAPPVGLVADASILQRSVDGVLLVVRAASTPRELIEDAVREIGRENVLAIVLNGAETLDNGYGQYGYY